MLQRMSAASALAACLLSGGAFAGSTLTLRSQRGESVLLLDGNRMRTEEKGKDEAGTVMIYDGDAQKMIVLDTRGRTYTEMTPARMKAQLGQAGARMKDSMARMSPEQRAHMKAALERMEPEQRKRMEAMMNGGGAQPAPTVAKNHRFEKTGKRSTVAGYACEGFREFVDEKLMAEGCFIPWSAGAVPKSDLGALTKMREFAREAGQGLMDTTAMAQMSEMPGFPGEWSAVGQEGAESTNRMSLVSIQRGSIPAESFQVPAGYTASELGRPRHH